MRIALFAICLADIMLSQAAQATVTILERLGHQVRLPERQTRCGQMHADTGYFKQAAKTTRNHVETSSPVLDDEWDAIVIPSGSYIDAARHEQSLVAEHMGDTALAKRVEQIAVHTYDLTELLIDIPGTEDVGVYFPYTVTYHPTCHSLRITKVVNRPYRLLEAVEALILIDLPDAEVCCGFGGTSSMKNSETSTAMLADKMSNMMSTHVEVLCAGDYSCLMYIGGGLSRVNSGVRIMHLTEILASAKGALFEGDISSVPKHVQHIGSSQHTQAVAR